MKLEQTLEMYRPTISQERQTTYLSVRDLESLSAGALYTGPLGDSLGFGSISGDEKDSYSYTPSISTNLPKEGGGSMNSGGSNPLYGASSKIFIPESTTPLLRYDPADENHNYGHLHVGNNPALKGIKGKEAIEIYVEAWFRNQTDKK